MAAKQLSGNKNIIMKYARHGAIYRKKFILSLEPLSSDLKPHVFTPQYGPKGTTIYVYSSIFKGSAYDRRLLNTFTSASAAGKHFNCDTKTILKYAQSNVIFQEKFLISLKPLSSDFIPVLPKTQGSTIFVYSLDKKLLNTFSSAIRASKALNYSHMMIIKYARLGEIF